MPIRPDLRRLYGREWRTVIRPRILRRARNRCERCHKPDRAEVFVWRGLWRPVDVGASWRTEWGIETTWEAPSRERRRIRVVLTVAHLNHDPADNRDENLAALCQWCHLHHDRSHHKDTRAGRKDAARPLLAAAVAAP